MATIDRIISIERRKSGKGKYYVTTAEVDGDVVEGWSLLPDTYHVGDSVQKFFDDRFNRAKMRKHLT